MVYTRSKFKLNKPRKETLNPPTSKFKLDKPRKETLNPPTTNILKTLISAFESPEGIKSPLLKSSYYVLIQLSSKQQISLSRGADQNELFMKTNDGEVGLSLKDVCRLSTILFKELQKRLKQLHSLKHDVSASLSLELEELNLLIRCCMVILTFHVPQEHLLQNGRVLLLIFKKLSLLEIAGGCDGSFHVEKLLSCQCMYSGENSSDSLANVASLSSLELFDPCIPSITAILEVVIDELLVHGRLSKYLQMIDSLSPTNERLFKHDSHRCDFGIMMEMMCSHFSLSIFDEGALHEFLDRITWVPSNNAKALELSLIAARTLLQNHVVLSSPKLLQAHIVSLVSNVISVRVDCERLTPDARLMDCYLSVFESSVILYTQHMSILESEKHSVDGTSYLANIREQSFQHSFGSCIEPTKWQKLNQLMTMLNDTWNSNLRNKFFKRKSDLVASSIEYIQQSQCILDVACRDEVLSFLNCTLLRAANDVNDIELPLNGDASLQDICLLASLSMLTSNSLIQAVWCLRYSDRGCPKSLKDLSFCKEYNFIVGVIRCFRKFSIRLPIQKISYKMMETHPTSHKESKLMLLHFLGLLSLSFDSGLDFLVKSCISMIMALTNLFVLEEGNTDALKSLADSQSLSSDGSPAIYEQALECQYRKQGLAEKFQKIRTLYVSKGSAANDSTQMEDVGAENLSSALIPFSMDRVVGIQEETCHGDLYLKARLQGSEELDDFDDLADFVECRKGKDYVGWLKGRDRFRQWKLGKKVKQRLEKKKLAWRSMKAKS